MFSSRSLPVLRFVVFVLAITLAFSSVVAVSAQEDQNQQDQLEQLQEERQQLEEEIQQLEEEDAPQRQIRQRERELRQVERQIQRLEQQQDQQGQDRQQRRGQAEQVTLRELTRNIDEFDNQRVEVSGQLQETPMPAIFMLSERNNQVFVIADPERIPDMQDGDGITITGTAHEVTQREFTRTFNLNLRRAGQDQQGQQQGMFPIVVIVADQLGGQDQQAQLRDVIRNPEDFTGQTVNVTGQVGEELDREAFTLTTNGQEILVVGDRQAIPSNLPEQVQVQGQVQENFNAADVEDQLGVRLNQDVEQFEGEAFILAEQVQAVRQQGQQQQQEQEQEAQTVEVGLTEYQINMPQRLEPGRTTFVVTNTGSIVHNFVIEGQGIDRVFRMNLQPGETSHMTVDLEEGRYTVYCPVGNHRELGMELQVRAR